MVDPSAGIMQEEPLGIGVVSHSVQPTEVNAVVNKQAFAPTPIEVPAVQILVKLVIRVYANRESISVLRVGFGQRGGSQARFRARGQMRLNAVPHVHHVLPDHGLILQEIVVLESDDKWPHVSKGDRSSEESREVSD